MPDSGKTEENEIRKNSLDIVAASGQSLSFASCPTCPGPKRTPILHAGCTPLDSAQADKDTDGDVDASVIDNKANAAAATASSPPPPPSSSSKPAENKDKSSASYPFCTFHRKFHGMSLDLSGKEQCSVIRRVFHVPAEGSTTTAPREVAAASNAGPSAVLKGKRKAEDTKDGPESPTAKTNQKAAAISWKAAAISCEADKTSHLFWQDREQKIFPDSPGSSARLGPCMQILSSLSLDEPMDVQLMDGEPQRRSMYFPPFAAAQTAGFSFDLTSPAGRILIPFTDERLISDPDRVGLERLNVLLRANIGEEPTVMDHGQV